MTSSMMPSHLTITSVMRHAEQVNGFQEIVSLADGDTYRYSYQDAFRRVRKLANGLAQLELGAGDIIATLAWNDHRHFEIYYAVSCSGMVCHTINPRLFPEQIAYIVNHAQDKYLFVDPMFIPLLEKLVDQLSSVKGIVVLCPEADLPESDLALMSYESLIAGQSDEFTWPDLDESTPSALCYTSGTTGNPKGVMYTHRSTILHCYGSVMPDVLGLSLTDVLMPLVPMFHVNGWGMVYSAPMVGAKLVLPGPRMGDGQTLCELINAERVTLSAGVPTVWLALLSHLRNHSASVESLRRIVVGGAACPEVLMTSFMRDYGVDVQVGWGMTEMNPLGTYNGPTPSLAGSTDTTLSTKLKAGRPVFGVEMAIMDDAGVPQAWDGASVGAICVRGPWIINAYFRHDGDTLRDDGWFDTGDIGCFDGSGYLSITDRKKDVIKSGGEWISSIELENCAIGHPDVVEAAVVGMPHPKWTERPLLLVVRKAASTMSTQEMLDWFDGKVSTWWKPDDCIFVEALPHTATGKISKKDLREKYHGHEWPEQ